jgi:purine-binding chemotaxis protein CheW
LTLSLVFRARTRLCALPVERLVETMRPLPVTPFPGASSAVVGVARIRGAAAPVVDVGVLLGCTEPAQPAPFLTLRLKGRSVALAVEAVIGLRELSAEEILELPPLLAGGDPEAVAAIGMLDGELLLTLGTARLVPDAVWSVLDGGPST